MPVDSAGPSIEDLRTFLLLVDSEGLAAAALRIGIDQSAVSRRMKPFQERHGLIWRKGSSLVLTERGRELLPTIRAVVHDYDGLVGKLRRRTPDGVAFTIAVGGFGAATLIPEVVARFAAGAPESAIRVRVCRGRERIAGMVDGRFDLAVLSHSLEQIRATLGEAPVAVEPLPARPFVIVASGDSPDAQRLAGLPQDATATIRDLAGLTLVGLDEASGVRTQLERRAAEAGVDLRFGATGGGWLAAREYARHGLGAAIVPAEAVGVDESGHFTARLLDRPISPIDHLLHRRADAGQIGPLRTILIATATEQGRRQQATLSRIVRG
jgi:DNA-binding transcriptional LysR family regulator